MTADPGTYDLTPADVTAAIEDAADEVRIEADQARRVGARRAAGILASVDLTPMEQAHAHGLAMVSLAQHGRQSALTDAVKVWRTAELSGLDVDSAEWHRLMGIVRSQADRALGVTA